MTRKLLLMLILLVASPTVEVWADTLAPELKNNPFDQPNLIVDSAAKAEGQVTAKWSGLLQATLVSGADSLANVDGNLIAIGEDYNGYRLLRVGEGTATFGKAGVQITVVVGNDGANDNES